MNHGSFFSGIGGFDFAAELMGWNNLFNCEIDPFCRRVLKYYWPNAIQHEDIRDTDFSVYRGTINLVSGGFPCQPYSVAGKRLGKDDARHLWPEMLRGIREIQPRWVVGENVRGLVSWNGGLVFEEVQANLEAEGYEVQPFILPACGVGAPHRRDRIWFVAFKDTYEDGRRSFVRKEESPDREFWNTSARNNERIRAGHEEVIHSLNCKSASNSQECHEQRNRIRKECPQGEIGGCDCRDVANTNSFQRCKRRLYEKGCEKTERYVSTCNTWRGGGSWENFPTQSPVCGRNDGLPRNLDGITIPKWRNESIKSFGNAVVPQVVLQIYKAIEQYDTQKTN